MLCVKYSEPDIQNAYWEGFTQAAEITNLFVWDFRGLIIHAAVNYAGIWHDSRVTAQTGLYYPLLASRTPAGYALLAYSAFPRAAKTLEGKTIRGRKMNEWGGGGTVLRAAYMEVLEILLDKTIPSQRQAA
eukprot:IDg17290t1